MNAADFQTQLTSVVEMLAKTAILEIGKLFEENSLLLRLEISRCTNENESLKKKCHFLESELKSARKVVLRMNGTQQAPFRPPAGLAAESGHGPAVEGVFGKEWCMNLWRHSEPNTTERGDRAPHLDSSVSKETVNLLDDDEPEMIMIKEELFEDCSRKKKPAYDEGPSVSRDEGCNPESSEDYITYTVPSDEKIQSSAQQHATEQRLEGRLPTHEDVINDQDFHGAHNLTGASEERGYDCVFCQRTFNKLSYLKTHMRTHSGEKPFVCTVCGKRFAQKTYLRIHERVHSGERPYSCMECGKSFAQKSSLNVHLRSHTGEKPYTCCECGKSYAYKQGFNTHQCFT